MKRNKAAGPDEILIEMMKTLGYIFAAKSVDVINGIYDSGEIPEGLCRSILIELSK